jgi:hypothetical protein
VTVSADLIHPTAEFDQQAAILVDAAADRLP